MTYSLLFRLVGVLREKVAEAVEALLPERAARGDPALGQAQCGGIDTAGAHPPQLLRADQPARLQHLQVLHHRRQRHGQGPRQLADRGRPAAQALHHAAAGRVRERLEDAVERGVLVNHLLKYCAEQWPCQGTSLSAADVRPESAAIRKVGGSGAVRGCAEAAEWA